MLDLLEDQVILVNLVEIKVDSIKIRVPEWRILVEVNLVILIKIKDDEEINENR